MTREEIVNSLRCCVTVDGAGCAKCNDKELRDGLLNCSDTLKSVAADLIENQQREIEALRQAYEGLRFNLAALHGFSGHPDPVGLKGALGACPVCGGACDWAPETDTSTCRVCGYTNGKAVSSDE